jgi:hypothetical protein
MKAGEANGRPKASPRCKFETSGKDDDSEEAYHLLEVDNGEAGVDKERIGTVLEAGQSFRWAHKEEVLDTRIGYGPFTVANNESSSSFHSTSSSTQSSDTLGGLAAGDGNDAADANTLSAGRSNSCEMGTSSSSSSSSSDNDSSPFFLFPFFFFFLKGEGRNSRLSSISCMSSGMRHPSGATNRVWDTEICFSLNRPPP